MILNLCAGDAGPLGGGAPRPVLATLLADLASRRAPVAALGLARILVRGSADEALTTDVLSLGPREVLREEGGRVLLAAGFLGTTSIWTSRRRSTRSLRRSPRGSR